MSTNYQGKAGNVIPNYPAAVNVIAVTQANPAIIQTTSAHGLAIGDSVRIAGHQGQVAVNGVRRVIAVADATHYTIGDFTTGAGINAGGTDTNVSGTSQAITLGAYPIPSDGDNVNAAAVNPAEEEMGDRTAALAVMTGLYKVANVWIDQTGDSGTSPSTSWTSGTFGGALWWQNSVFTAATPWVVPNVIAGDLVELDFETTLETNANFLCGAKLFVFNDDDNQLSTPSYTQVLCSSQVGGSSGSVPFPVKLHGFVGVTTTGVLKVAMYLGSAGAAVVSAIGDHALTAKIYRGTGIVN
jgi:hypothetical protein